MFYGIILYSTELYYTEFASWPRSVALAAARVDREDLFLLAQCCARGACNLPISQRSAHGPRAPCPEIIMGAHGSAVRYYNILYDL